MDAFEHAIDNAPTRESTVSEIVELVAGSIRHRVLVVGSLPPGGRDLALIVRPCEERAVAESMAAAGLARRGLQWASFFDCSAYLVELIPARRRSLPGENWTRCTRKPARSHGAVSWISSSARRPIISCSFWRAAGARRTASPQAPSPESTTR